MLLLVLRNGWPDRLIARDHFGPVPDGHVLFKDWDELNAWKAAHPELNPARANEAEQAAAGALEAAEKAERKAIRALIPELKGGAGTNAERIARLEKATVRLLRDTLQEE